MTAPFVVKAFVKPSEAFGETASLDLWSISVYHTFFKFDAAESSKP